MSEITVSDARARLADVVDAARVGHDPVYLTRRGHRVAAVIDADDLDALMSARHRRSRPCAGDRVHRPWVTGGNKPPLGGLRGAT
ncbi:type II toxin-antitoxin system Phd/YefM family antitoxin [Nostocoides sp.]|uniref:type II toxin-antitoxin system Phd/YefM family antitoxin n=1 Tax=Nostocoides sp. TaxID=1917966 RepID=UPI003BAEAAF7